MHTPNDDISQRKLMNNVVPEPAEGDLEALLATTFDLNAEFFETDYLPAVLGMKAWSNRNWSSRIVLEKKLALLESATVWMEAERYVGRPRSLRVEVIPFKRPVSRLHAKVTVLVYKNCVRLLIGSANLTERGYRHDREAVVALTASERYPEAAALIYGALEQMSHVMQDWWTESATKARDLALHKLSAWRASAADEQEWFIWSGFGVSLWEEFLRHWPPGQQVQQITVVSPFWAEDPRSNFLDLFLQSLKNRGLLAGDAHLRLLTEAQPAEQGNYKPVLPEAYGAYDFGAIRVAASAHAVDPSVAKEEIDFQGEFVGRRSLHAKVMLLEGASTSLAYIGSANFTHRGWGLGVPASHANVEAGIILQRKERRRRELDGIVPNTVGDPVPLTGLSTSQLAEPEPMAPERPWPLFLRSILLAPAATATALELRLHVWPERVEGTWRLSVEQPGETEAEVTLYRQDVGSEPLEEIRVALEREQLNALLLKQEVKVWWWRCEEAVHYPVNVALAARHELPIAPGNARLEEQHMIAYYQGKVSWEDLFPDPLDPAEKKRLEELAELKAGVDTAGIQSYQIREFVEALHGILQDLKQSCYSAPAMRMALFGPVSPVRLGRSVMDAVHEGKRTAVGAGFQLVEILACLDLAHNFDVDEVLHKEWSEALQKATEELETMLGTLMKTHPKDFSADKSFARYRRSVRVVRGAAVL